ncbi:MAG: hypothetical protein J5949_04510, partial [Oscillospiraceae bacterium]|nr:hypothetical protein [Oscillospiraceae bacterium]
MDLQNDEVLAALPGFRGEGTLGDFTVLPAQREDALGVDAVDADPVAADSWHIGGGAQGGLSLLHAVGLEAEVVLLQHPIQEALLFFAVQADMDLL